MAVFGGFLDFFIYWIINSDRFLTCILTAVIVENNKILKENLATRAMPVKVKYSIKSDGFGKATFILLFFYLLRSTLSYHVAYPEQLNFINGFTCNFKWFNFVYRLFHLIL